MMAKPSTEYYDIILLGRTGSGKSTAGNKMLGLPPNTNEPCSLLITQFSSAVGLLKTTETDVKKRFVQADDLPDQKQQCSSATAQCEVLGSEMEIVEDGVSMKLRILDVPGFVDSSSTENNLQIIRWIVRIQADLKMNFRRVVYFLPYRGALEKADMVLQEELKVMYRYFGKRIFECMVLAGTNSPGSKFQAPGTEWDSDEIKQTQKVFQKTMELVTFDDTLRSPPVVYIGFSSHYPGSRIINDIRSAPVLSNTGLQLDIREDICTRCSVSIRCAFVSGNDKEVVEVCVINEKGETVPYEQSLCHPGFQSKYTILVKIIGGIGHVLTLGLLYFTGVGSWPGFTNSEKVCSGCKQSQGATGCVPHVIQRSPICIENATEPVVDHTKLLN